MSSEPVFAHPIGVALSEAPKYVASTTLTAPTWEDTTVLRGDLAAVAATVATAPKGRAQLAGRRTLRSGRCPPASTPDAQAD